MWAMRELNRNYHSYYIVCYYVSGGSQVTSNILKGRVHEHFDTEDGCHL